MQSITLFQLNEYVRRVLALNFPEPLWVSCEIARLNEARGHYFLELVEKEATGDQPAAHAEGVIWDRTWRRLRRTLGRQLDALLQEGMQVLLRVQVDFHERYGLKLVVEDIDLSYSLGKMEQRRRQIIYQLEQEGRRHRNGSLPLPPVLQRIAVLSSENAAGLQDYLRHLSGNPYGYRFANRLLPVPVQGPQVEPEMLKQLRRLRREAASFDCAVIIRGGGGRLDLAAFDSLELARAVADLPLPVLTGIGHDIDETVTDLVAHTCLKTPTAVADFLIGRNLSFESSVQELGYRLRLEALRRLGERRLRLQHPARLLQVQFQRVLAQQQHRIDALADQLPRLGRQPLRRHDRLLDQLQQTVGLLSPEATLRRGFTLTLRDGRPLASAPAPGPATAFRPGSPTDWWKVKSPHRLNIMKKWNNQRWNR